LSDPTKSIDSYGILIGVCPVCGGTGDYYGEILDPSDTPESVGRGYDLTTYKGRIMCNRCRKMTMAQDETEPARDWWMREEIFRRKVGFVDEVQ